LISSQLAISLIQGEDVVPLGMAVKVKETMEFLIVDML
jgi:hypothetical protein